MRAASAVTDDQVSDAKTVHALTRSVHVVKPVFSGTVDMKSGLTGDDASTSELKKLPIL